MMEKKYFAESELTINTDGSVFHLHVKPKQLADKVILAGDPGRVSLVAFHFEKVEYDIQSREFYTITGSYRGERISVVSTDIGCNNIDIAMNELDVLTNIDFATRYGKSPFKSLTLVRLGTCGRLQEYMPERTYIASEKSVGFDGLLNYHVGRDEACDLEFEEAFKKHMDWNPQKSAPYVIDSDKETFNRVAGDDMVCGVTIACGGFFGPQGRELRTPLADAKQNEKTESFEYNGYCITNFEMESSAPAGLVKLMGYKAMMCRTVIANRRAQEINVGYKNSIDGLI